MEPTTPLFTVLIPAHDAGATIARAVTGALAQSVQDIEVIVVNDGSSDDTGSIVRGFTDERVVLVEQAASGSPAGARNAGLRVARGEFIAFLDADDAWYPEKLALVRAAFEADSSLDAVAHDMKLVGPSGDDGVRAYRLDSRDLYQQLLYRGNFLTTSAMTVRTEKVREVGGFTEAVDRPVAEDLDLWLRLAQAGLRLRMLPEVLGVYTVGGGISGDHVRALRDTFAVLDPHYEHLASGGRLHTHGALVRRARALGALALDQMRGGHPMDGLRTVVGVVPDIIGRWLRYRRLG